MYHCWYKQVPLLVQASTTAGTRSHTLTHSPTHPAPSSHTPCSIAPHALLHPPIHPAAQPHTPCSILPHTLLHTPTHPAPSSHTPCCTAPHTRLHSPQDHPPDISPSHHSSITALPFHGHPPHLPSPPSPFKSPCMQNRISKTLLTLLKKLISVKKMNQKP